MESNNENTASPPVGFCQCSCGERTALAQKTSTREGYVRGEPLRYRRGHNPRKASRYVKQIGTQDTPCWIWLLARTHDGYGLVTHNRVKGLAHRHYFEQRFGPVPKGYQLDHLCRERACVNPDHLEPVTGAENVRRSNVAKLSFEQAGAVRAAVGSLTEVGARFGISPAQVSRIRRRKSWA